MAEGGEETVVHTKLVLDEAAEHAVERLKEGFEHMGEKVREVGHELAGMAKQALAVAAGFQIDHGIESIKEFGHEVIHAALASEDQVRSLAGLVAMTDKTGMSFEETQEAAKELHENLEGLAIESGQTGEAVSDAFEMIASRSQKSKEEVMALTDKMATASRVLPGGIGAIAGAWRDMETGIVRPRNAIVQLLVQTHTVTGSMKQVAKGISAMMQAGKSEEVFKLAEKAIDKMAKTAEKAPPTFRQTLTSLQGIRELAFKNFGEPMLASLAPPLQKLEKYFLRNEERITHWAHQVGEKVGEWITDAAEKIEHGFEYLNTHSEEIKGAIREAMADVKAVVNFIIDHKEAIALAFGAKMGIGAISSIAGGVGSFASMGGGGVLGLLTAGSTAAIAAAAAVAWAGVAIETNKLWHETDGFKGEERRNYEATVSSLESMNNTLEDSQHQIANTATRMEQLGASAKQIESIVARLQFALGLAQDEKEWKADIEDRTANRFEVGAAPIAMERGKFVKPSSKEGAMPTPATLDFRGSTFHIKQDFKDQDPDRVIFTFRKDLQQSAAARIQSRNAGWPGP